MMVLRRCRGKYTHLAKRRALKSLIQEACVQEESKIWVDQGQLLQSEIIPVMPSYSRVPDAKTANRLAADGVRVEQYLLAGCTCSFVCVSQGIMYLLNQSRIPAKLKEQVNAYKLWHMDSSGCSYDDFDAHRKHAPPKPAADQCFTTEQVLVVELGGRDMVKRIMQSAMLVDQQAGLREARVSFAEGTRGFAAVDFDISVFDQTLVGRLYGDVWQQLTAHAITATVDVSAPVKTVKAPHKIVLRVSEPNGVDALREHAYYTTERSQMTKLSAKDAAMLDDAVVILLTETKLRGRTGVYAEYMFALSNGERRRLSTKDKMTVNVKRLVEEYECWHLDAVGAYSGDWIQQQDGYPVSDVDDNETISDSKGDNRNVLQEELDEESEPEDMEDMQTLRREGTGAAWAF